LDFFPFLNLLAAVCVQQGQGFPRCPQSKAASVGGPFPGDREKAQPDNQEYGHDREEAGE